MSCYPIIVSFSPVYCYFTVTYIVLYSITRLLTFPCIILLYPYQKKPQKSQSIILITHVHTVKCLSFGLNRCFLLQPCVISDPIICFITAWPLPYVCVSSISVCWLTEPSALSEVVLVSQPQEEIQPSVVVLHMHSFKPLHGSFTILQTIRVWDCGKPNFLFVI